MTHLLVHERFISLLETNLGIILKISKAYTLSLLTYIWAIKLYLHIERYKLKTAKNSLTLAPLMIVGIFLSAGIPFLSARMIPFYALIAKLEMDIPA